MRKKEFNAACIFFFIITAVFFYKTFIHGLVPFPGDLLISEYNPWKTYSYLGFGPGGFPNKAQYFDVLRQMYPWKTLSLSLLKSGQFPFWNPYNFSGAPLFANFQSAVLYPLNLLYFLVPQIIAWSILIFLQPFLSGLFTYLFARKIGMSKIASYFSGFSYAFSSFLSVWLEYNTIGQVIVWLPMTLLAVEHLLDQRKTIWMIIFFFSVSASILAGHPQLAIYQLVFCFLYSIYRVYRNEKIKKRIIAVYKISWMFLLSIGICAIQILPGLELVNLSARSAHNYPDLINKILIQPWQLIMLIVPDFFGNAATRNYWLTDTYVGKVSSIGLVPLFFICFLFWKRKDIYDKFFFFSALVILLLATNNPITAVFYKWQIPFISSSSPTLCIFLFCFSLSMLAGSGIDFFKKELLAARGYAFKLLIVPLILIIAWIMLPILPKFLHISSDYVNITKHNLIYSTLICIIALIFFALIRIRRKIIFPLLVCLILLSIYDSFHFFEKFNPFVPVSTVFPSARFVNYLNYYQGIDRFWSIGAGEIEANFPTQLGLYSAEGYDPLYPKRYGQFIQSAATGKISEHFTDKTRSDAVIEPASSSDFNLIKERLKVLNLLGVKYILDRTENGSTEKTFPSNSFTNIYSENGWNIFLNVQAIPRYFLASSYSIFQSDNEFEKLFFAKSFNPKSAVLLEQKLPVQLTSTSGTPMLKLYGPDQILIDTNTNGWALLFLSDTYYPGWKAFIDGKETQIYRADYTFRSILIPEGHHQVSFTFAGSSFKIGSVISLISILIIIVWLFFRYIDSITNKKINA